VGCGEVMFVKVGVSSTMKEGVPAFRQGKKLLFSGRGFVLKK